MTTIKNTSERSFILHLDGRVVEVPGARPSDLPDGTTATFPGVVEIDDASYSAARKHPIISTYFEVNGGLSADKEPETPDKGPAKSKS